MKVYIQSYPNGIPRNKNFYYAYDGFNEMGFEIKPFCSREQLNTAAKEDVVVGYVQTVREQLKKFGIPIPELDYPAELNKYLGRRIWKDTINHINCHPELWPVFVKPVEDKRFTGVLVSSTKDLIGCGNEDGDAAVYCSEPISFRAEWRCFVKYGRILDIRRYKGNWKNIPDYSLMENAVTDYTNAPKGYAIDFGYTSDGRTLLLEVNDGYALGSYGLFPLDYAKLLSARWAELTGSKDECKF